MYAHLLIVPPRPMEVASIIKVFICCSACFLWLCYWADSMRHEWRPLEAQDSTSSQSECPSKRELYFFPYRTGRKIPEKIPDWFALNQRLMLETIMVLGVEAFDRLCLVSWLSLGMKIGSTPSEQERFWGLWRRKGVWEYLSICWLQGWAFALILALNPGPWEVHEDSCFWEEWTVSSHLDSFVVYLRGFSSSGCEHHSCACLLLSVLSWFLMKSEPEAEASVLLD